MVELIMTMTAEEIKEARTRLGWSQMALANALHVHIATVAAWERGTNPISGPAIVALRYMLKDVE